MTKEIILVTPSAVSGLKEEPSQQIRGLCNPMCPPSACIPSLGPQPCYPDCLPVLIPPKPPPPS